MINTMTNFWQNWRLTRWLQLGLGLMLVGSHFFYQPDLFTLAIGGGLLVLAAFNVSCVLGACATPMQREKKAKAPEVTYEEIKR